jgi:L-seryl-tRNA(Ser) seleniumtransferase
MLQLLLKPVEQLAREARSLQKRVQQPLAGKADVRVRAGLAEIGGGSLPTESLQSRVLAVKPKAINVDELARRMRRNRPPVFGRVERGEYVLDFRTLRRDEVPIIAAALLSALA